MKLYCLMTSGEYAARMAALVDENETLRAQLGALGRPVDRSLEGDTLDMHLQMTSLEHENASLKRGLQRYQQGECHTDRGAQVYLLV